jgi:hypothetical protein
VLPDVRGCGRGSAEMTISPMNPRTARLNAAPRCGARTRAGGSCRAPRVRGRPRCRLHGCAPGSGGQLGQKNGMYRSGKYSKEARELGALVRALAKDADVLTATVMNRHGLRPVKALRRRRHVKRALRAAKAKEQQK